MYRDRHEQCPRCGIALVSAGSVRTCSQCSGHWVTADVLREMAEEMVIPARPVEIELVPDAHPRLPCPQCENPMGTWKVHGVPIDRCDGHGLWFDRAELETVLYATSGQQGERPQPIATEVDALAHMLETATRRT